MSIHPHIPSGVFFIHSSLVFFLQETPPNCAIPRHGFLNFNHGGFGATPRPVRQAQSGFTDQQEAQPTAWFASGGQDVYARVSAYELMEHGWNAKCFIIFSAILGCWSGWNGIREDEVCLYSFRFFVASSNCVHTYSLKWSCCSCARAMVSGYKKVISQVRPRVAEMMNANSSDVVPWQSWHACTILYIYIRTCKYSNCSGRHPRKCILYRALPKPWGKFSIII